MSEFTIPCPEDGCSGELVERNDPLTKQPVLRCNRKGCKHTEPLPADRWMKRVGAPALFE